MNKLSHALNTKTDGVVIPAITRNSIKTIPEAVIANILLISLVEQIIGRIMKRNSQNKISNICAITKKKRP